jgi:D-sedoheptulose 7-phosphate isomerase
MDGVTQPTPQSMPQQIDEHLAVVHALRGQTRVLEAMADTIVRTFHAGGRLFLVGNGGSAADAQHIAAELVGRFKLPDRAPLPAIALTTDTSILTAVGNDFGADHFFERQVEALVGPSDCVWALSCSGNSPNIIRAVKAARRKGANVVGFTGRSGGELAAYCACCLCAEHTASDRLQEAHQLAYHLICGRIEEQMRRSPQM